MKRVGLWGTVTVLVLAFAGGFVSFIWLPRSQLESYPSWIEAFCAALGVPRARPPTTNLVSLPHSDVVLTHEALDKTQASDIGHGATLALRCTPCHGPTGISYANSPNLAGQYALAVYKQLRDYKTGVRTNSVMNPMAAALSDTDMRQIAAYYASLPKPPESRLTADPPPIVKWGDPMRNVAPCGSCHGDIDHTLASPWLKGEPSAYLTAQLNAFLTGSRTNDINGQMRAMVHGMTPAEMAAAAAYYSGTASP
jgi:cytochrome c553